MRGGARQEELAAAGDVSVAFEVDDRVRIHPDLTGAERGERIAGVGATGIGTEADAGLLALVTIGDEPAAEVRVGVIDPERTLPILEERNAAGVVINLPVQDHIDVVINRGVTAQVSLAEDVQGVAIARACDPLPHIQVVVAADGEVLEAEQLIGGGIQGTRTNPELGAAVDDQADGTRGLAERDALIAGRTGVIPKVEQALVERDRAVTETAALQLIEGGRESRAGVSRRATHNGGTAGIHEAAGPVVETTVGDDGEFQDAVQALD